MLKEVSGTKTAYYRSAVDGQVLKEFVNAGGGYAQDSIYAYLNGSHLASLGTSGGWKFTFRDHLGTLRVRAGSGGAIVSRHDFYPFGGEHTTPSADEDHAFTDQERDAETGLDYFIARHYGSNIGRFLQPDPIPITLERLYDPQRMNLYSYARNNPLLYTDPLGLDIVVTVRLSRDLTNEQLNFIRDNANAIKAEITERLVEGGLTGVTVNLDLDNFIKYSEMQALRESPGTLENQTIVLVNDEILDEGLTPFRGPRFGVTWLETNLSGIFMGELSSTSDPASLIFDIGELGAHETGHGLGLPAPSRPFIRTKDPTRWGVPAPMMQDGGPRPDASNPRFWDYKDPKAQRIIKEVNAIKKDKP